MDVICNHGGKIILKLTVVDKILILYELIQLNNDKKIFLVANYFLSFRNNMKITLQRFLNWLEHCT